MPAFPRQSLCPRYEAFVNAYLQTRNMVEAYKAAGFKARGHAAEVNASRLLKRAEIRCAIEDRLQELTRLALEEMHEEWKRTRKVRRNIAYSSLDDIVKPESGEVPEFKEWRNIPKKARRALKSVKVKHKSDGTKEVEYELDNRHVHASAIEEKYAIMPDNKRIAQKVDITTGGKPLGTAADIQAELQALYQELKAREAAELAALNVLPAHQMNGPTA